MPSTDETGAFEKALLEQNAVLYVDDERGNRDILELTLGDEFRFLYAESALEALEILRSRPVAVLLADQRMPGMTGIELFERVAVEYPEIQRILVTAFSDQQTAIDAINRGRVNAYITKPWRVADLRSSLKESVTYSQLLKTMGWLREEQQRREREAALAATRGEILHDLANAQQALNGCVTTLGELIDREAQRTAPSLFNALKVEVHALREAVEFVSRIHTRTRAQTLQCAVDRRPWRVADVLAEVVDLVRGDRNAGLRVEVACPDDLVFSVDRLDICRVLVNLIKNAIQAITDSGQTEGLVQLRVTQEGGRVHIRVIDNGPGIPEEIRPRLFERGATTRKERGGSGLGLSIVRQLTTANDGEIMLEDPPEGQRGAAWSLTFPAASGDRTGTRG